MALNREDRETFLAEPHIGALSVEAEEGRAPLSVPIWYQYSPGGELWFSTGSDSRKLRLIRAAGRLTIMVERLSPSIRYVAVSGPVVNYTETTREDIAGMAARYLPAEQVDGYVAMATAEHGPQTNVVVRPQQWVSSDLGSL